MPLVSVLGAAVFLADVYLRVTTRIRAFAVYPTIQCFCIPVSALAKGRFGGAGETLQLKRLHNRRRNQPSCAFKVLHALPGRIETLEHHGMSL